MAKSNESIEFNSILEEGSNGGAFVRIPFDIKDKYGKGNNSSYLGITII